MLRFGIEAADEDDEDTTEKLSHAIRQRYLTDARNLGISISISALAEQPEYVVKKTAKSLGVSEEVAAKILTSVGMSILMNGMGTPVPEDSGNVFAQLEHQTAPGANEIGFQSPQRQGKGKELPRVPTQQVQLQLQQLQSGHSISVLQPIPVNGTSANGQSATASAGPSASNGQASTMPLPTINAPIMGDFSPSGGADLCVVVGADDNMPAPSPFSARKRRRPRRMVSWFPEYIYTKSV